MDDWDDLDDLDGMDGMDGMDGIGGMGGMDDDGVSPTLLGTGYALYRHGQDRMAAQIVAGVRAALNDWDPGLALGGSWSEPEPEARWGVAPVDLDGPRVPHEWERWIGQDHLRERFGVRVDSVLARRGRLPHSLLVSEQPGMGKRYLTRLLANLVDARLVELVAPFPAQALYDALELLRYGDILYIDDIDRIDGFGAAALTTLLQTGDVQFAGEEVLASEIAVLAGTTRLDALPGAVVDGFAVVEHFAPYNLAELSRIVIRLIFEHRVDELVDDTLATRIGGLAGTPGRCRRLVIAARDILLARGECTIEDVYALAGHGAHDEP
ncbi:hypothetical protein ACFP3Q_14450 [Nocardioides sp. GCM10027113]|uniref:hypothetical protein n=1 Tax=unclassified Nocardioides TaxID=2615069 RepID=UPI00361D9596